MASSQVAHHRLVASRRQRDRSRSTQGVGRSRIREGQCGERGIRVERHRTRSRRAKGRRVIGAERTIETRGSPIEVPVRKARPVTRAIVRPDRLTGVD